MESVVSYRVLDGDRGFVDLLAGARYNYLDMELSFHQDSEGIREFSRGYLLEKQRRPEEALAFYQHFVETYDQENRLIYVYDEAKERLERLRDQQQAYLSQRDNVDIQLSEAEALAQNKDTLDEAKKIWISVVKDFRSNDFFQIQVQRADAALTLHANVSDSIDDAEIKSESKSGAANDQATSEESAETEKLLKGSKAADERDDEKEKQ